MRKKEEYTRSKGLYEEPRCSLEEKIRLEFFDRDGELSYHFQKNPLNSFRAELQAQIYIVLKENNIREQIEMVFRRFVLKVNEYVDGRESGKEALLILNELKDEWMKKRLQESIQAGCIPRCLLSPMRSKTVRYSSVILLNGC